MESMDTYQFNAQKANRSQEMTGSESWFESKVWSDKRMLVIVVGLWSQFRRLWSQDVTKSRLGC